VKQAMFSYVNMELGIFILSFSLFYSPTSVCTDFCYQVPERRFVLP